MSAFSAAARFEPFITAAVYSVEAKARASFRNASRLSARLGRSWFTQAAAA